MTFAEFKKAFQDHFKLMVDVSAGIDRLYEVEVDKDELWNLYLDSFPAGKNDIFRKRREFDCSCCRHFIRAFGNVVVIKNGKMISVWDFKTNDDTYQPVLDALSAYIHRHEVTDVYLSTLNKIGVDHNSELDVYGHVHRWEHFSVTLPRQFVYHTRWDGSPDTFKARQRDIRNVFKRSLDEISIEAVDTVLELIASNSLYRGEEWKGQLRTFRTYQERYITLTDEVKNLYAWEASNSAGPVVGKIRNHSIGTLLIDISEGMDLEQAVRRYEKIVAPTNYKRPKAIFTKKMLEDAQKKVVELGYMDSLARRHATLNDISVNNILFCNRDVSNRIQGGDVFADMMADTTNKPLNFDRVEEIGYQDFINKVLPTAREVEVYLENRHAKNMVSLIAPQNPEAPSMLKWNNNFGWAYSGNVTDSLKENVKAAGGKVDGVLRFSIQWNDGEDWNRNDFDAHCWEPGCLHPGVWDDRSGGHIFFQRKYAFKSNGHLDVDIQLPNEGKPAVENITWSNKNGLLCGDYLFAVHNYHPRGGRSGFKAEIEFDGQVHSFEYNKDVLHNEVVKVAIVNFDGRNFTIKPILDTTKSSRDIWNLKTNNFVPVSVMMYSPNYWDEQEGIGHRHCFFMLKDCRNPESPNGFYNEFLKNELMEHKRVFEALGGRMKVDYSDDQLSGIGFSTSKRDDIVVRVTGATKRVMKIKF